MPTASEELHSQISASGFIKGLEREVARILRKFEENKKPIIYDEEREKKSTLAFVEPPWQEELLKYLGFIEEEGGGGYNWRTSFLNAKARAMYERLKAEGYYSTESIPKSTRVKPTRV